MLFTNHESVSSIIFILKTNYVGPGTINVFVANNGILIINISLDCSVDEL